MYTFTVQGVLKNRGIKLVFANITLSHCLGNASRWATRHLREMLVSPRWDCIGTMIHSIEKMPRMLLSIDYVPSITTFRAFQKYLGMCIRGGLQSGFVGRWDFFKKLHVWVQYFLQVMWEDRSAKWFWPAPCPTNLLLYILISQWLLWKWGLDWLRSGKETKGLGSLWNCRNVFCQTFRFLNQAFL